MLKKILAYGTLKGIKIVEEHPPMPTYGKRDNYDDIKIMDNRKSILKGKPQK